MLIDHHQHQLVEEDVEPSPIVLVVYIPHPADPCR
jgi:hypothetical protein